MENRLTERLNNVASRDLASILNKISKIDEFKGWWRGAAALSPQILGRLKKSIVVSSTGASTRIEGSTLSDKEVERLLKGLKINKLKDRDSQEVAGYADVLALVFDSYGDMRFTEGLILQFHSMLLKYSDKDKTRKGKYKSTPNKVVAFDESGKEAVLFSPTEPFLTSSEMKELLEWTKDELKKQAFHPIIIIANFVLEFLAIHPFHDGNGRLSRVLTNLLLAQAGYQYMPYVSLEKIIEDHKTEYYLALRQGQKDIKSDKADIVRWLNFFVEVMNRQIEILKKFLETAKSQESLLSDNQLKVLSLFDKNDSLSNKIIVEKLKIPATTAKQILNRLLDLKLISRFGQGRSTKYRKK